MKHSVRSILRPTVLLLALALLFLDVAQAQEVEISSDEKYSSAVYNSLNVPARPYVMVRPFTTRAQAPVASKGGPGPPGNLPPSRISSPKPSERLPSERKEANTAHFSNVTLSEAKGLGRWVRGWRIFATPPQIPRRFAPQHDRA